MRGDADNRCFTGRGYAWLGWHHDGRYGRLHVVNLAGLAADRCEIKRFSMVLGLARNRNNRGIAEVLLFDQEAKMDKSMMVAAVIEQQLLYF